MKMYIGNFGLQVTKQELTHMFVAYGKVDSASVRVGFDRRSGQSKGFGFVDMPDGTAVDNAVSALNGKAYNGDVLKVIRSRPQRKHLWCMRGH